jgi:hypothetical protein
MWEHPSKGTDSPIAARDGGGGDQSRKRSASAEKSEAKTEYGGEGGPLKKPKSTVDFSFVKEVN